MNYYHCPHVQLRVLRQGLLRVAMICVPRGKLLFDAPCLVTRNGEVIHSPHMPQVAGYCPVCGEACGWRVPVPS